MFSHAAIASLNNLEMLVYNYVIKNRDKVMYMTIRELADAVGVSTTTVLRFCRKLKCEGYSEFRVRFKLYLEQNEPQQANFGASEIISFFKSKAFKINHIKLRLIRVNLGNHMFKFFKRHVFLLGMFIR